MQQNIFLEKKALNEEELSALLNYLLFRDCGGSAYSGDIVSLNGTIRKIAKQKDIELYEVKADQGKIVKEFYKHFPK